MENKSVLVSVIVPVYNVEIYLERCVSSLLEQSFDDYEILLIDDGSKDRSGALCDELSANHTRIRTLHKENGGLGSARNYGIANARGQYLCFVDSDDLVHKDYVKLLYEAICENDADISVCGYVYSSGKQQTVVSPKAESIDVSTMLKRFAGGEAIFNFAWNKMFKKNYIDRQVQLYADRHCAEDMYFNCFYYRQVHKVAVVSQTLYTYFININSLSNGRRVGFWEDMLLIDDAFRETCSQKGLEQKYADTLLAIMLRNAISNYYNAKGVTYSDGKAYILACVTGMALKPEKSMLGKVDKLLYFFVEKKWWLMVHASMKGIKFVKKNLFGIFCLLRGN